MKHEIGSLRGLTRIPAMIVSTVVSAALLMTTGCGGSKSQSATGPTGPLPTAGTVAVFLSSAPSTTVAAATVNIESASLTSSSSATTALTTGTGTYELNHLALDPTLVAESSVPTGAYQGLSFTFADPQLQVVDNLGNVTLLTSSTTPNVQLASGAVTVPDAITVAGGAGSAFTVTLDLGKSLSVDSQGNYTLTPVLSVTTASPSGPQMIGAPGQVASSVPASGPVTVQFAESGETVGLDLNAGTVFSGAATAASALTVGQMVDIDASLSSSGTLLATLVDSQPAAATVSQRGVVAGVGNDSSGNLVVYTILQ